jgi:enterochelin esterase-like enzyme
MRFPARTLFELMALVALAAPLAAQQTRPLPFEPAQSPGIAALQKDVESGNGRAVDAFWMEMAARHTPLVEPIAGDEQHVIVTFLWRGQPDTKGVLGVIPFRTSRSLLDAMLTRLLTTDVWFKTYKARSDLRFTYTFVPDPMALAAKGVTLADIIKVQQFDPLNPAALRQPVDPEDPTFNRIEGSVVELPRAAPQPWIVKQPGVPEGKVTMHRFKSTILGNERRIWVYTPPGYAATTRTPYRVLICFDGRAYLDSTSIPTPVILDNLQAKGKIPPMLAVLVDSLWEARKKELSNHEPFLDFLAKELLPWLHKGWHVTSDPSKTIACGLSAGGLTAGYVAFKRPDLFGNVLSQSGAFWRGNDGDDVHHEWLTQQFEASPVLPIHFYMDGGLLETTASPNNGPPLPVAAQHLRDVLKAKGYPVVEYRDIPGTHEPLSWRGTLAEGLLFLLDNEAKGRGARSEGRGAQ